ncbi:S8 family serine peptidase [Clostridium sp. 'deep sea']|uniref:S8 family serine peptidase n=1 Tax=Clostridium sp. 'deep sea' TaxID=2779445 RepID=UPI00189653A0|nr:S8 family serine peptidase [Clostridium sp. 'deep sea']QOR36056.1 S8 family serine peptidase [Clostridium sp. 'deep sea']
MKKQLLNKRLLFVVLSVALITMLSLTAFANVDKVKKAQSMVSQAELPKMYDTNGDKVFENLQVQMDLAKEGVKIPVMVMFNKQVNTKSELNTFMQGYEVKYQFQNIPAAVMELTKTEIEVLAKMDFISHIEYDQPVHICMETANQWYGATKARTDFGVNGDKDGNLTSYTKNDVVIAIIDTGIDGTHVDLDGGKIIGWKDYVNNQTTPYDDHYHGTHVAGIAAGSGDGNSQYVGVAKGAALVGLKVLDSNGSGSMSNVAASVDWCVTNKSTYGIDVINMSLGTSGSSDGTDITSVACNNAVDAGISVVVAAGNSGPNKKTIGSPGAAAKVITVASMYDVGENGYVLAKYSSRGPTADERMKPDIAAPGTNITAANANTTNGYRTISGTSMASPFTAGTVALMLDANPSLTPAQVKTTLANTALDWGTTGQDVDFGHGRLDAYEAIKDAGNYTGTNIVVPNHFVKHEDLAATGKTDVWSFNVTNTSYPIAISMITKNFTSSIDFDINLIDPSGTRVTYSWYGGRQETIRFAPTVTGTYKLEVDSYRGSGSYFFDISAGTSSVTLTQDE